MWDDEVLTDPDRAARRVIQRLTTKSAAEFFAGIGLVGLAIEEAGFEVRFANDVDPIKKSIYASNFDAGMFVLDDIRLIHGDMVPTVDLATASFPCTDLSLAGPRTGIHGVHSSTFWEFVRIMEEMGPRKPKALLVENVSGFATSAGGRDLEQAIMALNALGYSCDLLQLDAVNWVPQSRPRVFIVGSLEPLSDAQPYTSAGDRLRTAPLVKFARNHPHLRLHAVRLPDPPEPSRTLSDIVERLGPDDERWWSEQHVQCVITSMSPLQRARLTELRELDEITWRTAYRRTRAGKPVWEVRSDSISGCLRTARGGSSRQALVEAGKGFVRIRWMTSREYARLMGAPNYDLSSVTENQALFAMGDAVCVPAVSWLAVNYLRPLVDGEVTRSAVTDASTQT